MFKKTLSMLAIALVAAFAFTSCGSDDDPIRPGHEENEDYELIAPCVDWGNSEKDVVAYMSDQKNWNVQGFKKGEFNSEYYYTNRKSMDEVNYYFTNGQLESCVVFYYNSNSRLKEILDKYAKMYDLEGYNRVEREGMVTYTTYSLKYNMGVTIGVGEDEEGYGVIAVSFAGIIEE